MPDVKAFGHVDCKNHVESRIPASGTTDARQETIARAASTLPYSPTVLEVGIFHARGKELPCLTLTRASQMARLRP